MSNKDKSKIIPLTLSDNSVINVEVTQIGEQPVASQKRMFDEATQVIKSVAEDIASTLAEIKQEIKPDKFSVSLGLQIAVESGKLTSLIVKGSGSANLQITMEWGK